MQTGRRFIYWSNLRLHYDSEALGCDLGIVFGLMVGVWPDPVSIWSPHIFMHRAHSAMKSSCHERLPVTWLSLSVRRDLRRGIGRKSLQLCFALPPFYSYYVSIYFGRENPAVIAVPFEYNRAFPTCHALPSNRVAHV
jgi:hypothetical protein